MGVNASKSKIWSGHFEDEAKKLYGIPWFVKVLGWQDCLWYHGF